MSNIANHAAGTFVFDAGRIHGGNTTYYYTGRYRVEDTQVVGNLEFFHFSGDPIGLLGYAEQGCLEFQGTFAGTGMELSLSLKESALVKLSGVLIKRMNLGEEPDAAFWAISDDLT